MSKPFEIPQLDATYRIRHKSLPFHLLELLRLSLSGKQYVMHLKYKNQKRADSFESALCVLRVSASAACNAYSEASSSCSPSMRICSSSRSSASMAAVTSC